MKIFCIGRNYAAHAKELNNDIPDEPLVFCKPHSAVLKNGKPFFHPDFSNNVHHEVELVEGSLVDSLHVSLFDFDFALQTLHQSLHLTVYRLSHSLLPLWVLVETLRMNTNYDSSKK